MLPFSEEDLRLFEELLGSSNEDKKKKEEEEAQPFKVEAEVVKGGTLPPPEMLLESPEVQMQKTLEPKEQTWVGPLEGLAPAFEVKEEPVFTVDLSESKPKQEELIKTDLEFMMQEENPFYKSVEEYYDILSTKNIPLEKIDEIFSKAATDTRIPEEDKKAFETAVFYYLRGKRPSDDFFSVADVKTPIFLKMYDPKEKETIKQLYSAMTNKEMLPEKERGKVESLERYFKFVFLLPEEVREDALLAIKTALEEDLPVQELLKDVLQLKGYTEDKLDDKKGLTFTQKRLIRNLLSEEYKKGISTRDILNAVHSFGIELGGAALTLIGGGILPILATWAGSLGAAHLIQNEYLDYYNNAIDFIKEYENNPKVINAILKGETPRELKEFADKRGLILTKGFEWIVKDILKKGNIDPRVDFSYNTPAILGELVGVAIQPTFMLSKSIQQMTLKTLVKESTKFITERELINIASQLAGQKIGELTKDWGSVSSSILSLVGGLGSAAFTGRIAGKVFGDALKDISLTKTQIDEALNTIPRTVEEITPEPILVREYVDTFNTTLNKIREELAEGSRALREAILENNFANKELIDKLEFMPHTKGALEKSAEYLTSFQDKISTITLKAAEISEYIDVLRNEPENFSPTVLHKSVSEFIDSVNNIFTIQGLNKNGKIKDSLDKVMIKVNEILRISEDELPDHVHEIKLLVDSLEKSITTKAKNLIKNFIETMQMMDENLYEPRGGIMFSANGVPEENNPVIIALTIPQNLKKLTLKGVVEKTTPKELAMFKNKDLLIEAGRKLYELGSIVSNENISDVIKTATYNFVGYLKDKIAILKSAIEDFTDLKQADLNKLLPDVDTEAKSSFVQLLSRFSITTDDADLINLGASQYGKFIDILIEEFTNLSEIGPLHELLDEFLKFSGKNGRGIFDVINKAYYIRDTMDHLRRQGFSRDDIVNFFSSKIVQQLPEELVLLLNESDGQKKALKWIVTEYLKNELPVTDIVDNLRKLSVELYDTFISKYQGDIIAILKEEVGREAYRELLSDLNGFTNGVIDILDKFSKDYKIELPFMNTLKDLSKELTLTLGDISRGNLKDVSRKLIKLADFTKHLISQLVQFKVYSTNAGDFVNKLSLLMETAATIPRHKFPKFRRWVISPLSNVPELTAQLVWQNVKLRRGLMDRVANVSEEIYKTAKNLAFEFANKIGSGDEAFIKMLADELSQAGMVMGRYTSVPEYIQRAARDHLEIVIKEGFPMLKQLAEKNNTTVDKLLMEIFEAKSPIDFMDKYRDFFDDGNLIASLLAYNNLVGLSIIRAIEDNNSAIYKMLPEKGRMAIDKMRDIIETLSLELSEKNLLPENAPLTHYIHYFYRLFDMDTKLKIANSKIFQLAVLEDAEKYAYAYETHLAGVKEKIFQIISDELRKAPLDVDEETLVLGIANKLGREVKVYPPSMLNLYLDEQIRKLGGKTRFAELVNDNVVYMDTLRNHILPLEVELRTKGINTPADVFVERILDAAGLNNILRVRLKLPQPEEIEAEKGLLMRAVYSLAQELGTHEFHTLNRLFYGKQEDLYKSAIISLGIRESYILEPRKALDFSLKRFYLQELNPMESVSRIINRTMNLLLHYDIFNSLNKNYNIIVGEKLGRGNPEYVRLNEDRFMRNLPPTVKKFFAAMISGNEDSLYMHKDFVEGLKDLYQFQYGFSGSLFNILKMLNTLAFPFKIVHVLFNVGVIVRNIIGNTVAAALGSDSKLTTGIAIVKSGLESIRAKDSAWRDCVEHGILRLNPSTFQELDIGEMSGSPINKFARFLLKLYDLASHGKIVNTLSMANAIFDDAVRVGLYKYYLAQEKKTKAIITPAQKAMLMEKARQFSFDYLDIPPLFKIMRDTVMPFVSFPYLSLRMVARALKERPIRTAALLISPILFSEFLEQNYDVTFSWEPFSFAGNYLNMLSIFTAPTEATRMLFSAPWVSLVGLILTGNDLWSGREIFDRNALYFGTVAEKKRELLKQAKGLINFFINNYVPDIYQDLAFMVLYGKAQEDTLASEPFFYPTYSMQKLLGLTPSSYFQPLPLRLISYFGVNVNKINYDRLKLELVNEIKKEIGGIRGDVAKLEAFKEGQLWMLLTPPNKLRDYLRKTVEDIGLRREKIAELADYLNRGLEGLHDYLHRNEIGSLFRIIRYPIRKFRLNTQPWDVDVKLQ